MITAIDIGNSLTKAILFDDNNTIIHVLTQESSTLTIPEAWQDFLIF